MEIAIGEHNGTATFYCFNEPALNSFNPATVEVHLKNPQYYLRRTIEVPVEPLASILNRYLPPQQTIDLLSIDVEGMDLQVLQSNDWQRHTPLFVLVEEVGFLIEQYEESAIYNFLKAQDYRLVAVMKRSLLFQQQS